jgi:hypothetical protein
MIDDIIKNIVNRKIKLDIPNQSIAIYNCIYDTWPSYSNYISEKIITFYQFDNWFYSKELQMFYLQFKKIKVTECFLYDSNIQEEKYVSQNSYYKNTCFIHEKELSQEERDMLFLVLRMVCGPMNMSIDNVYGSSNTVNKNVFKIALALIGRYF